MKRISVLCLLAGAPLFAQIEVIYPTAQATTPPLRDLIQQAALAPSVPVIPMLQPDHPGPLRSPSTTTATDPVVNGSTATTFKATAGLNFLSNGNTFPGFTITGEPADTNGSAGTTQYVQWVNTKFSIFDKAGNKVAGPTSGVVLWSSLPSGICKTQNSGDIVVTFDKTNSRWVFTQFAITSSLNGQYAECIAVSNTADATGTFNLYEYDFADFPDYPKMGIWPDAYYITYNVFSHTSGGFLNVKSCAYNGAAMRAGAATPTAVCANLPAGDDFSVMPADVDGATPPPAGAPNPQWELYDIGILRLFSFHADFVTPANSTYTGPTTLNVAPFTFVCNNFTGGTATCINQPGTAQLLDTLGERMMFRAAYRNRAGVESVVLSHTVDAGGSPTRLMGVRWYEMRVSEPSAGAAYTATVFQQATYSPPTAEHRWMPSIAMDKVGNILMGYSASNGTATFPSIRVTGRTRTEPRGFMEAEQSVQVGTGSQVGHSRWGDYSTMSLDPSDDCTFWFTTMYLDAPNGDFIWKTRTATYKFANCQ